MTPANPSPYAGGSPASEAAVGDHQTRELYRENCELRRRLAAMEGQAPASQAAEVCTAVAADIEARRQLGLRIFGKPLVLGQEDGRDPLREAYEEALDLVVYLRWELSRREGKSS
jgi:hypothetical protein